MSSYLRVSERGRSRLLLRWVLPAARLLWCPRLRSPDPALTDLGSRRISRAPELYAEKFKKD